MRRATRRSILSHTPEALSIQPIFRLRSRIRNRSVFAGASEALQIRANFGSLSDPRFGGKPRERDCTSSAEEPAQVVEHDLAIRAEGSDRFLRRFPPASCQRLSMRSYGLVSLLTRTYLKIPDCCRSAINEE